MNYLNNYPNPTRFYPISCLPLSRLPSKIKRRGWFGKVTNVRRGGGLNEMLPRVWAGEGVRNLECAMCGAGVFPPHSYPVSTPKQTCTSKVNPRKLGKY